MKNTEIERKYLLHDDSYLGLATAVKYIQQGYLSTDPDRTVRVRRCDDKAYLTIKGKNKEGGVSHFEWEKQISVADAEALLPLCKGIIISKKRYLVPWRELTVEVDVFEGAHRGLAFAEIEIPSEDYEFELPPFIGDEVTADKRYQNSYLSEHELITP